MDDKTKPDCANCERLRHAWKQVNSLRIDAIHDNVGESNRSYMDIDELEQRLSEIERTLTP